MSKEASTNQGRKPLVDLGSKSYGDIAKASGFGKSVVHRWLTRQAIPRRDSLPRLAKALGISEGSLVRAIYAKAVA